MKVRADLAYHFEIHYMSAKKGEDLARGRFINQSATSGRRAWKASDDVTGGKKRPMLQVRSVFSDGTILQIYL